MARLPQPGSDGGIWGDVLNDFLSVSHSVDGTLKTGSITNGAVADNTLTSSKLVNNTITGAKLVNGTLTDTQIASANIDGAAGTPSLRTLGTGANQAMPGNAVVMPGAHASTHKGDGSDPIAVATTSVSGLMSSADKTKLDGVASGATANSPDATLLNRANHTGTQTLSTISDVTASATELNYVDGVTSAIQGQLDGKQPADGDLTDISVLTPSNDDVLQRKAGEWTNRTPTQLKLDLALTSTDVGLGNVDNTSDATKNAATATLTNKRINPRVLTIASNATPTINTDDYDAVTITALGTAITSMTSNLSGTPVNFQKLIIRIKDDGTARAITWGASFEAKGVALPTTTVISKVLTVGFIYDTVTAKWGCVASVQEA